MGSARVGVLECCRESLPLSFVAERNRFMSVLSKSLTPTERVELAERRGTARLQITVAAEVVEINSGTRFSTRTTDLGPGGCFVDTLMPLPISSAVHVRLHKDTTSFEATGVVTFSQAGLGMGIAFDELPAQKLSELEAWLIKLTSTHPARSEAHAGEALPAKKSASARGTPDLAARLVRLLVKRGVISERDAEALENDPLL
jgi:hypothetical protein